MTGIIKDLLHTPGSGGIIILLEDGTRIFGDNGTTIRSLHSMYGNVIQEGHCFDKEAVIGKQIGFDQETGELWTVS